MAIESASRKMLEQMHQSARHLPEHRPSKRSGPAPCATGCGPDDSLNDCVCASHDDLEDQVQPGGLFQDDLLTPDSLMPEQPAGGWDWQLLRKFHEFWPKGASGPPDFPWLGTLVRRKRAWRWVSQFPQRFARVDPSNTSAIRDFIAQTLTGVQPPGVDGDEPMASEEKKKCCPPKPPTGGYPSPTGCEFHAKTCTDADGDQYIIQQLCCLNDEGGDDCRPACGDAPEDFGGFVSTIEGIGG